MNNRKTKHPKGCNLAFQSGNRMEFIPIKTVEDVEWAMTELKELRATIIKSKSKSN